MSEEDFLNVAILELESNSPLAKESGVSPGVLCSKQHHLFPFLHSLPPPHLPIMEIFLANDCNFTLIYFSWQRGGNK